MNSRKSKLQKIFSMVLSVAIVAALAFGVVSVVKNKTSQKSEPTDRYMNLNENNTVANENTTNKNNDVAKKETHKSVEKEYNTSKQNESEPDVTKITEKSDENKGTEGSQSAQGEKPSDVTQEKPVTNANVTSKYIFSENDTLTWPVTGDVVLGYSMDKTIWFPTLAQYKCNSGIVIAASEGSDVYAAASGVVSEIRTSTEYGTTIVIDIGNGYKLEYGQVDNVLGLASGTTVIEGDVIAKVAKTTRYYTKEGDNVFFKVTKEGEPVNPLDYMGE